jgi:hypothetical protein
MSNQFFRKRPLTKDCRPFRAGHYFVYYHDPRPPFLEARGCIEYDGERFEDPIFSDPKERAKWKGIQPTHWLDNYEPPRPPKELPTAIRNMVTDSIKKLPVEELLDLIPDAEETTELPAAEEEIDTLFEFPASYEKRKR